MDDLIDKLANSKRRPSIMSFRFFDDDKKQRNRETNTINQFSRPVSTHNSIINHEKDFFYPNHLLDGFQGFDINPYPPQLESLSNSHGHYFDLNEEKSKVQNLPDENRHDTFIPERLISRNGSMMSLLAQGLQGGQDSRDSKTQNQDNLLTEEQIKYK